MNTVIEVLETWFTTYRFDGKYAIRLLDNALTITPRLHYSTGESWAIDTSTTSDIDVYYNIPVSNFLGDITDLRRLRTRAGRIQLIPHRDRQGKSFQGAVSAHVSLPRKVSQRW